MPGQFNLLAELAQFSFARGIPVGDSKTIELFASHMQETASEAVKSAARLHGHRTQAMFEALLLCLNKHCLLKVEDTGRLHPADRFKVSDFRVVLPDRSQWLIEVKNVYRKDAWSRKRPLMKRRYQERLEAYASATGGQLKLAVYWAPWRIWTLVSPGRLVDVNGDVRLDIPTAMKMNELSKLGDVMLGTRAPLELVVTCDPAGAELVDADSVAKISISAVQVYCSGHEVTDPVEQQVAWIFMLYGNWNASMRTVMHGKRLEEIRWLWGPEECANEDLGFEVIGSVSELFAQYYTDQTIEDRKVVQFNARPQGESFESLMMRKYESKRLPIWHFPIQPNFDEPAPGYQADRLRSAGGSDKAEVR